MTSAGGEDLDRIEEAIKELRHAYEKYFAGVERFEPLKDREQVKKQLLRLLGENSKNTARRFRLQSLQATLITYEQYWNRVARQIEEGTFKRDRLRAERLLREQQAAELAVATTEAAELEGPHDVQASASPLRRAALSDDVERLAAEALATVEKVRSATSSLRPSGAPLTAAAPTAPLPSSPRQPAGQPGPTRGASPPAGPAAAPPVLGSPARPAAAPRREGAPTASIGAPARTAAVASGERGDWIEKLHREYLEARHTVGQSDPVSIDSFAATIRKQASDIKARLRCDSVEFKVAVKDGKAILKATPR